MTTGVAATASQNASQLDRSASPAIRRNRAVWFGVASALFLGFFVMAGLLLLPLLGFETDEVMFVHALWLPKTGVAWFSVYHHLMPSMMMSYLGALKSWVYAPLLAVAKPSIWVVRVPAVLLAALTIVLTGRFLLLVAGRVAAFSAIALLCCDSGLLLTSVFDWGPVVLQNLLLVGVLLVSYRFYQNQKQSTLFWLGLLTGLALWNKALFLWNLSGLVVALLLFARRQVAGLYTHKRFAVLVLGLFLGSYPLLRYNLKHHGSTVGENAKLRLSDVPPKARLWQLTLNGLAARDSLIARTIEAPDHIERPFANVAWLVTRAAGLQMSTWGLPIGVGLLTLGMVVGSSRQRRLIAFFLVSCLLAWAESALTVNAGSSIHHTALFLIQWYCAVALAIGACMNLRPSWAKAGVAGIACLLCARSLIAVDITYASLIHFDSFAPWTNADEAFVNRLMQMQVKRVIAADWGLSDVVTTRSLNRIAVDQQTFELSQRRFRENTFRSCLAPECVVVTHVPSRATFVEAQAFLRAQLAQTGIPWTETDVEDSHGQRTLAFLELH